MLILFWLLLFLVLGAIVGSFLNVCIARLPLEKSVLWPGSRCGACFQAVRWYDNIPLISYWVLRGRCRHCGASFSIRYFLVELLTALGFVGLFYVEVIFNIHEYPHLGTFHGGLQWGFYPWQWIGACLVHCVLFSFLLAISVCDLDRRQIPLGLTVTGTLIGILASTLFPWPWPSMPELALAEIRQWESQNAVASVPWWVPPPNVKLGQGVCPWPVWGPLPDWLPPGSWQLGLLTSLAGALAGTLMMRVVGFLFTRGLGKEAMGLGDADVMMMVGAFLGWQVMVIGFFLSVFPALVVGVLQLLLHRDNSLPFGPSLALGTMMALLGWRWLGVQFRPLFFDGVILGCFVVIGGVLMYVLSFLMRMTRKQ